MLQIVTGSKLVDELPINNILRESKYALLSQERGPHEEILVLTFKQYGPTAVRPMPLECQKKYFPYGSSSRLIRALLYTYPSKPV